MKAAEAASEETSDHPPVRTRSSHRSDRSTEAAEAASEETSRPRPLKIRTSNRSNESLASFSAEYGITTADSRSTQRQSIKHAVTSLRDQRGSSHVDNILMGGAGATVGCFTELSIQFHGFRDDLEAKRLASVASNKRRGWADRICKSALFQMMIAAVIIGHVILGVFDTDTRAANRNLPDWFAKCEACIVVIYLAELVLRIYNLRLGFFLDLWNDFEAFLVVCDLVMMFTTAVGGVSLLRSIRLLRVFRVLRKFLVFREVYLMVQGVGSACRTLGFGSIIAFMVLTSLSVLAVETLHPLAMELTEEGVWADCERCQRSFESVMAANLTFFKIILAGDSWGEICVPLIERYKEAAIILPLVFLTIQIGVVNIIIAVLVDRIQEARIDDEALRKAVKEEQLRKSYRELWKVFKSIDTSGDGNLSIDELMEAYHTNHIFKGIMNMMDFTTDNIDVFFDILDQDHSGEVNYEEFVAQLHMMKVFDSHTMLVIIKHLVENLQQQIDENHQDQKASMRESLVRTSAEQQQIAGWHPGQKSAASYSMLPVTTEREVSHDELKPDSPISPKFEVMEMGPCIDLNVYSQEDLAGNMKVPQGDYDSSALEHREDEFNSDGNDVLATTEHRLQALVELEKQLTPYVKAYDGPLAALMDGIMGDNLSRYDNILEHIDALEADMHHIIDVMESVTEEIHPVLLPNGGEAAESTPLKSLGPGDSRQTMQAFKETLKQQVLQMKQIKPSLHSCVSSLFSWYHGRDDAPLAPRPSMAPDWRWDSQDLEPMMSSESCETLQVNEWCPEDGCPRPPTNGVHAVHAASTRRFHKKPDRAEPGEAHFTP